MRHARCTWRSLVADSGNACACHSWCAPGTRSRNPSQRVFRALSPTYCWPLDRLVEARVGRSPCTDTCTVVTRRGGSRRSVAHCSDSSADEKEASDPPVKPRRRPHTNAAAGSRRSGGPHEYAQPRELLLTVLPRVVCRSERQVGACVTMPLWCGPRAHLYWFGARLKPVGFTLAILGLGFVERGRGERERGQARGAD